MTLALVSKEDHLNELHSLGFAESMINSFSNEWEKLAAEGYEMYAMYRGSSGTSLEGKAACVICSRNSFPLKWGVVITPSMDSAAVYSICEGCAEEYVTAAIRQKALGRLLRDRNTRPT